MSANLETVKSLLKDATDRLLREENAAEPNIGKLLFLLSNMLTICIGIVASIETIYASHYQLEKDHNTILKNLSKKVIYLSAVISIGGGVIIFFGKLLFGVLIKP